MFWGSKPRHDAHGAASFIHVTIVPIPPQIQQQFDDIPAVARRETESRMRAKVYLFLSRKK
jgi:hypothetical protein